MFFFCKKKPHKNKHTIHRKFHICNFFVCLFFLIWISSRLILIFNFYTCDGRNGKSFDFLRLINQWWLDKQIKWRLAARENIFWPWDTINNIFVVTTKWENISDLYRIIDIYYCLHAIYHCNWYITKDRFDKKKSQTIWVLVFLINSLNVCAWLFCGFFFP